MCAMSLLVAAPREDKTWHGVIATIGRSGRGLQTRARGGSDPCQSTQPWARSQGVMQPMCTTTWGMAME